MNNTQCISENVYDLYLEGVAGKSEAKRFVRQFANKLASNGHAERFLGYSMEWKIITVKTSGAWDSSPANLYESFSSEAEGCRFIAEAVALELSKAAR